MAWASFHLALEIVTFLKISRPFVEYRVNWLSESGGSNQLYHRAAHPWTEFLLHSCLVWVEFRHFAGFIIRIPRQAQPTSCL